MKAHTTSEDELQDQFVKQIVKHLKKSGTMDHTMCEKAELSPAHWSNIKSHWKRLTLEMAARIANACGKKVTITVD